MSAVDPQPGPHPDVQQPYTINEDKPELHDVAQTPPAATDSAIITPEDAVLPEAATTTRPEIWAYYAYYIGANGLSLFNFGPTAFQNLLAQAAPEDTGLLVFAGRARDVNSIVLLANGISFACQAVLFLCIGAYADFATGRRWVLVVWSVVGFAVGFAWLGVHEPEKWRVGAGLYVVGLVAYQLTLTYWTAAFPALARNLPVMKEKRRALEEGSLDRLEFVRRDEKERSRLSNVAFFAQSVGSVVILAIIVGIMFAVHVNDSVEANNWGLSVLIAFATACWVALSVPWFVMEKTRPGLKVPVGMNLVTVGFWQLWEAMAKIWHLKQSLIYLIGYFLLGDSLNTTVTVIATLQNQVVNYDTLTLTYLLIVGIVAQAVGIGLFWTVQKQLQLSAKTMFNAVMVGIILLDGWGMIGNWTDKFGFHNVWEIWVYQTFYGLFVCPWYSYSQILISSVSPPGHEFLFFSLFSIIGKTSSFIGPLVSSAIIDATPGRSNDSAPFYFLFALSLVSAVFILSFLDLEKSAVEQEAFLEQEKARILGDRG
jgi:MFS-type transporter involved in bile tolerance (Atg22 family)